LQLGNTASSHSRLLYFQRAIEKLGMGTRIFLALDLEQTYWREFLVNTRLFPGVREFLQQLKSIGIRTANITDLTAQIQFRKMVYFGLDEYFDYVVTSEEAGCDKPNIEPFKMALNKLQADPADVWMIGDSPENDIYGAKSNFKMTTLQKIHKGVKIGSNQFAPDVSFDHYSELISLISDLQKN
jgi:putative hydrolase of the HAD superfamily